MASLNTLSGLMDFTFLSHLTVSVCFLLFYHGRKKNDFTHNTLILQAIRALSLTRNSTVWYEV
jgi:hypothetical protein